MKLTIEGRARGAAELSFSMGEGAVLAMTPAPLEEYAWLRLVGPTPQHPDQRSIQLEEIEALDLDRDRDPDRKKREVETLDDDPRSQRVTNAVGTEGMGKSYLSFFFFYNF